MKDSVNTLMKVLQIREREKKEAQVNHSESVATFERLAKKLYTLLVKKEQLEQELSFNNYEAVSIGEIQNKSHYLDFLTKEALSLQNEVNHARERMEQKREYLTEAHIEMKKIEKMIETRQKEIDEQVKRDENLFMD